MLVTDQKQAAISRPLSMPEQKHKSIFSVVVQVAALGYFVDIYDLLLLNIVSVKNLHSLNLTAAQLLTEGEAII